MRLTIPSWVRGIGIFALLYVFLISIGLMEHAFKLFGQGFAEQMIETTANPYVGVCIGILATSLVQSSSLTTSLVIGMVAGGALDMQHSVPIIMGANIGTSVTNTVVSLGHIRNKQEFRRAFAASTVHDFFNVFAVIVLFPLQVTTNLLGKVATSLANAFQNIGGVKFASPVKAIVKPTVKMIGGFVGDHPLIVLLIAVVLLFISLKYLTTLIRSLVMVKLEAFFDRYIFKTAIRSFGFGLALTVLVQSSSIATSLVVPLAGAGLLTLVQIYPYTLGANIGTTITALLASLVSGSPAPVSVAFSHLMFNVIGIGLIWPVPAIRRVPMRLAEFMAEMAIRNRMVPFLFVIITFFVIPLLVITISQL